MPDQLAGLHVLILEDEFLIAMDVEQLCRDHCAVETTIVRAMEELDADTSWRQANAAVIDLMLAGTSTLPFAARLRDDGVPFVFASGYGDTDELARDFPGVPIVSKPYGGQDLIDALNAARLRQAGAGKA